MKFKYSDALYNNNSAEVIVPILLDHFKINSVLDVGCGTGNWAKVFYDLGVIDVEGIDQKESEEQFLLDKTKFTSWNLNNEFKLFKEFDLVLCLEVAEHIEELYADSLIRSLVNHSDLVLFSAAVPFQGGQNHLNEQLPSYWAKKFKEHGYHFYDGLRSIIWENPNVKWWYKQNIFFVSKNKLDNPFFESESTLIHPELYLRNSLELAKVHNGNIGIRYLLSIIFKFIKRRLVRSK